MTSTDKWGTALWVGQGDAVQCITDALTFSNGGSVLNADLQNVSSINKLPLRQ